jgi:O-methyltransferase
VIEQRDTAPTRNPLTQIAKSAVRKLDLIPMVHDFVSDPHVGAAYSVGAREKLELLRFFRRTIRTDVLTLSAWFEHLEMARTLLSLSPSVDGDVVELGCFRGGSSVNLSHVCAMVGRKLIVCDSFEGLPEPDAADRVHQNAHVGTVDLYERGRFAATLDEVQSNIRRFGHIELCEFLPGYFETSLPAWNRPCAMVFFDADLVTSLRPCLHALWPHLQEGCRFYVHEARSLALVSVFFDSAWWRATLATSAPGFIGGGTGLPLRVTKGSSLGYAVKPFAIASGAGTPIAV